MVSSKIILENRKKTLETMQNREIEANAALTDNQEIQEYKPINLRQGNSIEDLFEASNYTKNISREEALENIKLENTTKLNPAFIIKNRNEIKEINKSNIPELLTGLAGINKKYLDFLKYSPNDFVVAKNNPELWTVIDNITNPIQKDITQEKTLLIDKLVQDLSNKENPILNSTEIENFKKFSKKILDSTYGNLEDIGSDIKTGWQIGNAQADLNYEISRGEASYRSSGEFKNEKEILEIEKELYELNELNEAGYKNVIGTLAGSTAEQFSLVGAQMLAGLGAGAVGGLIWLPAGVAAMGTTTILTTKLMESNFALREYSKIKGISPEDAYKAAEMVGWINGSIEAVADQFLKYAGIKLLNMNVGKIPAPIQKLLYRVLGSSGKGNKLAEQIMKNGELTLRHAIIEGVKATMLGNISEIGEEIGQELTTNIAGYMLDGEYWWDGEEMVATIKKTAQAMVFPSVAGAGWGIYNTQRNVHYAQAESYKKLKEVSKANKEDIKNNENAYNRQYRNIILDDSPIKTVQINYELFEKKANEYGTNVRDFADKFKVAEQIELIQETLENNDNLNKKDMPIIINQADFQTAGVLFDRRTKDSKEINFLDDIEDDLTFLGGTLSNKDFKNINDGNENYKVDTINQELDNIDKEYNTVKNNIASDLKSVKGLKKLFAKNTNKDISAEVLARQITTIALRQNIAPTQLYNQVKPFITNSKDVMERLKDIQKGTSIKSELRNKLKENGINKIYIGDTEAKTYKGAISKNKDLFTSSKIDKKFNKKNIQSWDEVIEKLGISEAEFFNGLMDDKVIGENSKGLDYFGRILEIFRDIQRNINNEASLNTKDYLFQDSNIYNNEGKVKTDSPEFKAWFKDSKVVDKKGKPLVVYHGTLAKKIDIFDKNETKSGVGFYFTNDYDVADSYTSPFKNYKNVMSVYLAMQNPLIIKGKGNNWQEIELNKNQKKELGMTGKVDTNSITIKAKEKGYDGVIFENIIDTDYVKKGEFIKTNIYVAFEPNQIKSIDNRGSFDINNENIYYQKENNELLDNEIKTKTSKLRELEEIAKWLEETKAVVELTGKEFVKGEKRLLEQVYNYYQEIGGNVEREGLGEIILDKRGIKSSINHGIGQNKISAFKAVPEVIKQGKIIDITQNYKNRGYDSYVITAPIKIGNNDYICEVVINRNQKSKNNRFYLHEVEIKEGLVNVFHIDNKTNIGKAPTTTEGSTKTKPSRLILSKIYNNVKQEIKELTKNEVDKYYSKTRPIITGQNKTSEIKGVYFNDKLVGKVIGLFENANIDTLLHESGHFWLDVMFELNKTGEISELNKEHWADVSKFLDIKESQTKLTREQQEKFAKAFIEYLANGKAPNTKLAKVFEYIRQFLVKAYNYLANKENLSDEVRGIFDKMLDYENIKTDINNARDNSSIFKNITDNELRAELESLKNQRDIGSYGVVAKEVIKLENEIKLKEIKEKVILEITNKIENSEFFTQEQEMLNIFTGYKEVQEIAKEYLRIERKKEEITDMEADFIRKFSSFNALFSDIGVIEYAKFLEQAPTKAQAITQAFNIYLKANHPELLEVNNNIAEETLESLDNEAQDKIYEIANQLIEKLDTKTQKEFSKERAKFKIQSIRNTAIEILAQAPVKDQVATEKYFLTEKKEAILKEIALKKGDTKKALEHLHKELLNKELRNIANKNNKEVNKIKEYLAKLSKKRIDGFNNIQDMAVIGDILKRIGDTKKDYFNNNINKYVEKNNVENIDLIEFVNNKQKLEKEFMPEYLEETYQEFLNRVGYGSIPNFIMSKNYINIDEITIDQLREINNLIKYIIRLGNKEQKFLKINAKENIKETIAKAVNILTETTIDKERANINKMNKKEGIKGKLLNFWNNTVNHLESFNQINNKLGGYENDYFKQLFYYPMDTAIKKELDAKVEYKLFMNDILKKYYTEDEIKTFNNKVLIDEYNIKLSKNDLIGLLLITGSEEGKYKFLFGGLLEFGYERWQGLDLTQREDILNNLISKLEANDITFANEISEYYDKLWKRQNELDIRVKGFATEGREKRARTITLKNGEKIDFVGAYFHLKKDPLDFRAYKSDDKIFDKTKAIQKHIKYINRFSPNKSFLKEVSGAVYTLNTNFLQVMSQDLDERFHDLEFREIGVDMQRLVNNENFKNAVVDNKGVDTYNTLKRFITDTINPPIHKETFMLIKAFLWLTNQANKAYITFSGKLLAENMLDYGAWKSEGVAISYIMNEQKKLALDLINNRQAILDTINQSRHLKAKYFNLDYTRELLVGKETSENYVVSILVSLDFSNKQVMNEIYARDISSFNPCFPGF